MFVKLINCNNHPKVITAKVVIILMKNTKVREIPGKNPGPEISYTGGDSFAFEPVVPHEFYIPEKILMADFRAEMDTEIREKLKHLAGRGALFSGFPGTGKTALIKWLANQDKALIIGVEKDDSKALMTAKFNEARDLAASGRTVYVVFDEIDEFGSKEALASDIPKISILLRELDGLNSDNKTTGNLYFFATTNNLQAVDQRLMRAGRLEELIEILLPTTKEKERITASLLKGTEYSAEIAPFIPLIAKKSRGYTPADLRGFLKAISISIGRGTNELSESSVLASLKAYTPTAKKGFEYFKDPEFALDDVTGREMHLKFMGRILKKEPYANFLLYGPNGTGKTLMPEVLANWLDMNYIRVSGSELQEGIVGEGTKKIKRLINLAKLSAPSIVLFDETEGIISRRGTISHRDDETAYLNSVLSRPVDGVYFFLTTNTPHLLNETTMTRLHYKIFFELPDHGEIKAYLDKKGVGGLSPESLEGYSFRDLENVCRVSSDYGEEVLCNFLAQYTRENRNRTEDWKKIKYLIGDSLELERIVHNINGGRK